MQNKFIYSNNNRRFHTYDYYLQNKYGQKVAKIALNAGFSCPHISSSEESSGGCIFCCSKYHNGRNSTIKFPSEILAQFNQKKAAAEKKWGGVGKYIAYFQTGTNTFAPLECLKKTYESVLNTDGLVGIDIATRPDCITEEIAVYLAELNTKTDVTIELGLQTMHNQTAAIINRGYTLGCFEQAYKILGKYKVPVTVHIINSLPGETPLMMLETAKYIASLAPLPLGVKIHMLNIIEGTELHRRYVGNNADIKLLSRDEYADSVIAALEVFPPQIVIMRVTGDPEGNKLVAPEWTLKKFAVMNEIDKKMQKLGTYQGRLSKYSIGNSGKNININKDTGNTNMQENSKNNQSLTNILSVAKRLLDVSIKDNGVYADFTMGNGNDTLYIKKKCPSAKIYAFDIQQEALDMTRRKLESEECLDGKISLILDSHANFRKYICENLDGAVFNLGYLPGGDRKITTKTSSTVQCLKNALECLNVRGIIVVVVYPGHEEGAIEGREIAALAENLDSKYFDSLCHRLINIETAPYIIAFQKKI